MKKIKTLVGVIIISIPFIMVALFSACDFINKPLREKMQRYYSVDANYRELEGNIVSIDYTMIEINITTPNHNIPYSDCVKFKFYGDMECLNEIQAGDCITFISAPYYFYNGHDLPIVALEKDGEVLLSFEAGKRNLLSWVEKTFD